VEPARLARKREKKLSPPGITGELSTGFHSEAHRKKPPQSARQRNL